MKLYVNDERTVLFRVWTPDDDDVAEELAEVALRPDPSATWGPPVRVKPERIYHGGLV